MDSYLNGQSWFLTRKEAVNSVRIHSGLQNRRVAVSNEQRGGKSVILQCFSKLKLKDNDCKYKVILRKSCKRCCWYIDNDHCFEHKCVAVPRINTVDSKLMNSFLNNEALLSLTPVPEPERKESVKSRAKRRLNYSCGICGSQAHNKTICPKK